ncbi:hypothetical protein LSH36_330g04050 [Paralvinella palmiformis]|uniref:Uncharacterized protein n=1 Tax=Paralvinella palmiformis TaxID=53620 RepID=A0AAD9JGR5_9ANNE|nr:hypothetical protein LSH36_330g04050 [Paralvinella palmiformis]
MSVDMSAMPPWKKELLERKHRQEEEDKKRRAEELERLSHMPPWKRELMLKKKKSTIYMSRSASANEVDKRLADGVGEVYRMEFGTVNGSVPIDDNGVTVTISSPSEEASPRLRVSTCTTPECDTSISEEDQIDNGDMQEEHLLPIECNPWLKLDSNSRRRGRNISRKSKESDVASDGHLSERSGQGSCLSPIQNSHSESSFRMSDQDVQSDKTDDNDSVFDEEEVTYGKGFVHKLLRKFKHMSAREDSPSVTARRPSPKRAHSSENILDDRNSWKASRNYIPVGDISGENSSLSKLKAQSMDCLLSKTEAEQESIEPSTDSSQFKGYSEETLAEDTRVNNDSLIQSTKMQDCPPGELVLRSVNQGGALEDLPRINIVSAARSVFESISTTNQVPPVARQHHSPERLPIRSSSASNISSSHSLTDSHISHSYSVSSTDQQVPTTGSVPVIRYTHAEDSAEAQPLTLKASSNQKTPGVRFFFSGKKLESPVETSAVKNLPVEKMSMSVDTTADYHVKLGKGTSSTTLQSSSTALSSSSESSSTLKSASASVTSENHCPAPHVPKAQEHHDQNSRDQSQFFKASSSDGAAQKDSTEAPALSEEITMVLNQSAKEADDSGVLTDTWSDDQGKSLSGSIPVHRVAPVMKDTTPSIPEHRNPEANRLNLNLNLNELSRKKTITDDNTDINRNNKFGSVSVVKDSMSYDVDGDFPVPMRRKKKTKRPAPSGPGSLLIRPASNLVAAGVKAEYLCLNRYHDIKDGKFAPAKKRPSYYYDEYSDDDIPITNVDDYLPVTNIDDVSPVGTPREGDPTQQKRPVHRFEFVGAGVILDRSLLSKSKHKKVQISNIKVR